MSWTDEKGCRNCQNCGMDMDMEPFCVDNDTLVEAALIIGYTFPYGLNINDARRVCEGENFIQRKPLEDH